MRLKNYINLFIKVDNVLLHQLYYGNKPMVVEKSQTTLDGCYCHVRLLDFPPLLFLR